MTEVEEIERIKRIAEGRIWFIEGVSADIALNDVPNDHFDKLRDADVAWRNLMTVEGISPFVLRDMAAAWLVAQDTEKKDG